MIGTENDLVDVRLTVSEAVLLSFMVSIGINALAGTDWKPLAGALMSRFTVKDAADVTATLSHKLAILNLQLLKEYE